MYRCEATTVSQFIRHVAVNYISRGYFFCVKGIIPPDKDPTKTDDKIIEQYQIALSKWARLRRRRTGLASVQYLRCAREFVILATHGEHRFFEEEKKSIQDVREMPLHFGGYSVAYRDHLGRGRVSVRIERNVFEETKRRFESIAAKESTDRLVAELIALRWEPFAPVRQQIYRLIRAVNRIREVRGFEPVAISTALARYRASSRARISLEKGDDGSSATA
jgi:hypothetical protein